MIEHALLLHGWRRWRWLELRGRRRDPTILIRAVEPLSLRRRGLRRRAVMKVPIILPLLLLLLRPLLLLEERLLRLRVRRWGDRRLIRRRGYLLRSGTALWHVWLLVRCSSLGLIRVVCGLRRRRRRRLCDRRGWLLGLEVLLRLVLLLLPATILLVPVPIVCV